jgi:DNA-binding XRE family transcriptional regulator
MKNKNAMTKGHAFRTMREMLLEAPPDELAQLAQDAGLDLNQLIEAGRNAARTQIQCFTQRSIQPENLIPLHKGLNTLLIMLRRRDGLDESELAQQADIEIEEIKRIESEPGYVPGPRTIFNLEKQFGLPSGVLAKLSGAVKHQSPAVEERALEFAANAKAIGRLTRAERQLLNEFIKFLAEKA